MRSWDNRRTGSGWGGGDGLRVPVGKLELPTAGWAALCDEQHRGRYCGLSRQAGKHVRRADARLSLPLSPSPSPPPPCPLPPGCIACCLAPLAAPLPPPISLAVARGSLRRAVGHLGTTVPCPPTTDSPGRPHSGAPAMPSCHVSGPRRALLSSPSSVPVSLVREGARRTSGRGGGGEGRSEKLKWNAFDPEGSTELGSGQHATLKKKLKLKIQ